MSRLVPTCSGAPDELDVARAELKSWSSDIQRTGERAGEHGNATAVIFHCEVSLGAVLPLLCPCPAPPSLFIFLLTLLLLIIPLSPHASADGWAHLLQSQTRTLLLPLCYFSGEEGPQYCMFICSCKYKCWMHRIKLVAWPSSSFTQERHSHT